MVRQSSLSGSPDRRQICSSVKRNPHGRPDFRKTTRASAQVLNLPELSVATELLRHLAAALASASGAPGKKSEPLSGKNGIDHSFFDVSNRDKKLLPGGAAVLAIVIVAALSFAGVIAYILYLTPGPNDHI